MLYSDKNQRNYSILQSVPPLCLFKNTKEIIVTAKEQRWAYIEKILGLLQTIESIDTIFIHRLNISGYMYHCTFIHSSLTDISKDGHLVLVPVISQSFNCN